MPPRPPARGRAADANGSRPVDGDFTPALGRTGLSGLYDPAIALLTRAGRWRRALFRQIAPTSGDRIVDIGCGTGTLALLLKRHAGGAVIIGLDPDPDILDRARRKADRERLAVTFEIGFARDTALIGEGSLTKATSSLVFHQTPMAEKRAGLAAILKALRPGGELHLADYGLQRTWLMRRFFRTVQALDGAENTQPNADGVLPELMKEAGFRDVEETLVVPTLTGSISLYRAVKAPL